MTMQFTPDSLFSLTKNKIAAAVATILLLQSGTGITAQELKLVGPAEREQPTADAPLRNPTQMPQFPGGRDSLRKFLSENIQYPKNATKDGQVVVEFIVAKDGTIGNIRIVRSLDAACDAEVLKVLNAMPRWEPGRQDDKPVPVYFILPVSFREEKRVR